MAPMVKFVKALFLGLVSKSNWRRSSKSRDKNTKKRQIIDAGDFSSAEPADKDPNTAVDAVSANALGKVGSIGILRTVFWAQLPDGSQIAVKRLDTNQMKGAEDFAAEAKLLGNIRHKNVSKVCGFCADGQQRLIVYDYIVNLSLYTHLHGHPSSSLNLDWSARMSIAIGAAEGLAHLHHEAAQRVVHGEIKSTNILLDANFEAKWADFGLMRLMQEGCFVSGGNKGGVGYLPPEYHKGQGPSQSGDVFGFGILLLELISGKKPPEELDSEGKKYSSKPMSDWAEPLISEGRYSELVDPKLQNNYTRDALNLVVYVVTMCAQSSPSSRLTMIEVADLLKCGAVLE